MGSVQAAMSIFGGDPLGEGLLEAGNGLDGGGPDLDLDLAPRRDLTSGADLMMSEEGMQNTKYHHLYRHRHRHHHQACVHTRPGVVRECGIDKSGMLSYSCEPIIVSKLSLTYRPCLEGPRSRTGYPSHGAPQEP